MNKKIIKFFACALVGIMTFSGCQKGNDKPQSNSQNTKQKEQEKPKSKYVETLKLEGGVNWGMGNPYLHDPRGPGSQKTMFVFDTLLTEDLKGKVQLLAKEWKINDKEYTFILNDNIKWHDGKPLTANDVAFTIDYQIKHPPVSARLGNLKKNIIDSYEVVDEKTIKIKVKELAADTLDKLGGFYILPKHIWEKVEDPAKYTAPEAFIGSGPYKWGKYDGATGSYEFIANKEYYGRKPVAGRVLFIPVSNSTLAFENGEIDLTGVPADLLKKYENDKRVKVIPNKDDFGFKMVINMDKKPEFKDINLRKALYAAIDREAIVEKIFRGQGSVGSAGFTPKSAKTYNEKTVEYKYNPEEAKKAFEGKNISINILAGAGGDANNLKMAELIKNDLEKAGIKVTITAVDRKVRDDRVIKQDFEFAIVENGGWASGLSTQLTSLFNDKTKYKGKGPGSMGAVGYTNDAVTELCIKQQKETDINKRIEMLKEIQLRVSQEVPMIFLATKSSYSMYKPEYYDGWQMTFSSTHMTQIKLSYVEKLPTDN